MAESCPSPRPECKYFGTDDCVLTQHHLYFPRRDYKTRVEKQFRELPGNKVTIERCAHEVLHQEIEPPVKPSRDFMMTALQRGLERRVA